MATKALFAQGQTILDGSGNGSVTLRPSGESWRVNALSVNVDSRVIEASCYVYKNFVGPNYVVDNTISGSTGDTSDTIHELTDGESLICVWSGGDPGAKATAIARGESTIPDGGFSASRIA